jgi:pSer/pThr/pTyr-binding forkhead associated (FHA) protein
LRRLAAEALGCRPWVEIETLLPTAASCGHLWVLDEAGSGAYTFPILDEATIGRSRDNTLVVPRRFSRTSRHHARLSLVGDTVWLHDNHSTHGTFVNGQPVAPEQGWPLCEGDRLSLGDVGHPGACQLRFDRRLRLESVTESTVNDQ